MQMNECHCMVFLDKGFKFKTLYVCNGCLDVLMYMNLSNFAILKIRCADYCCIISRINKSEAINLMENINFNKKSRTL